MSRPGIITEEYLKEDRYQTEAEQCGGAEGTSATLKLGIDPKNREHLKLFAEHRLPDGTRPMAWQANSPTWLFGLLFTLTRSVNAWLKTLSQKDFGRFIETVFKPSAANALEVLNPAAYARQKVNGQLVRVKAEIVGVTSVHVTARDGNLAVHAHCALWRKGLTADGQILSWYDPRFLFRHFAAAREVFHRSIAAGLEAEFGLKAEVKDARAEVVGLPQALTETTGTRRKAALEYLAERGIPPTQTALQLAVYKTRPPARDWDLAERVTTWNAEARQALGQDAAKFMPPPPPGAPPQTAPPAPAVTPPTPAVAPVVQPQQPAAAATTQQPAPQPSATSHAPPSGATQQQTSSAGPSQGSGATQQQTSSAGSTQGQGPGATPPEGDGGFTFFRRSRGRKRTASAEAHSRTLWASVAAAVLEVAKTATLIARKAFVRRPDVVRVDDPFAAYHQFRDRTAREALREVRNKLRSANVDSWNAMKTLCLLTGKALELFAQARRPRVELKPGTVLMVSRKGRQTLTKDLKDKLETLARQKGLGVRYAATKEELAERAREAQTRKQNQTQTP